MLGNLLRMLIGISFSKECYRKLLQMRRANPRQDRVSVYSVFGHNISSEVLFIITDNSCYFESLLCAQHCAILFNHNDNLVREVTIVPIS